MRLRHALLLFSIPLLSAAGEAPQLPPAAANTVERPPFALSLVIVDLKGGISQAVLPLTYYDRAACELAGQQWMEDVVAGGVQARLVPVCVPQTGDLGARLARERAASASTAQGRPWR